MKDNSARRDDGINLQVSTAGRAVTNALGSGMQINLGYPSDRPRVAAVVETIGAHDHAVFDEFIGRRSQVQMLTENLLRTYDDDAAIVSVISGLAGVGKTALARYVASQTSRAWSPSGAIFVDMRGYDQDSRVNAEQLFGPILYALGAKASDVPTSIDQQAAVFHHQMALLARDAHRVMLIFDNVSDISQVSALLPRQRAHRAVLTSRDRLGDTPDATFVSLPALSQEEAISLVDGSLRRRNSKDHRTSRQRAAAAELASLCGFLPLALQISASLLADEPGRDIKDMVAELSDSRTRLDGLAYGEHGVESAFCLSYENLGRKQAQIFRLVAIHPGPHFSSEATAALTGESAVVTRRTLAQLARSHLIEYHPAHNRWQLHDLVRIYARQMIANETPQCDVDDARRRLLKYYAETADSAESILRGQTTAPPKAIFPGATEAIEWFDAERPSLIAAISLAEIFNFPETAMRLSLALAGYFNRRHQPSELLGMTFTASTAFSNVPTHKIRPDDFDRMGYMYQQSGFLEEALANYEEAISLYRVNGNITGLARSLRNFGVALMEAQRTTDAIAVLVEAADLCRRAKEAHQEASALTNLGNALRQERRFEDATEVLRRAAELHRNLSDLSGEAAALTNLGAVLVERARPGTVELSPNEATGFLSQAAELLNQAADLYQRVRDQRGEASALTNLGSTLRRLGRFDGAHAVLLQAAALYGEAGDWSGQAGAFTNMASVLAKQGKAKTAIDLLGQAISLYAKTGDSHGQAGALTNLGMILSQTGEAREASIRLTEAATLYNQDRDFERERRALKLIEKISNQ